jgi:hypothetical protein
VRPVEHVERRGGADVMRVDLLHRTAETLRATDGAVYGHDRVRFLPTFAAPMALNGLGGETMRGGYAEGYRRLDDGEVWRIATNQFSRFHALFRPEARERYEAELRRWLEPYQGLPPADILDCLYIHFRCGRWIGGTSRSATMSGPKLYPFLDNRLALQITRAPAAAKLKHRLIRSLIRRFSPAAADLPLALEHWGDAPAAERERARQEHPTAFESPTDRPSLDWRDHLPPPLLDHIRRYCVTEGRLDLLASLLDVDAARTFLLGDAPLARTNKKVLFGLYSACVMTSEPWLTGRLPSAPITITLAAAA